jgi:P pilus assembly chaperone PapD
MKKLFSALALCLCATAQAGPTINVGTVYDYLAGDKSTYLKRVFNGGESTAFVRINVYEITFDADGNSIETPLDNLNDDTQKRDGLMASPARLIIPPKGMQATRLLYRGERDQERYYRVRFVPVMPDKEDQFEVTDAEREAYKESMSAGVNILAGYGTVFFVQPKHTRFDTKLNDSSASYRIDNAGNTTVVLDELKDCDSKNTSDCMPEQKHHIRPGKSYEWVKAPGRLYTFSLKEGNKNTKIEVGK